MEYKLELSFCTTAQKPHTNVWDFPGFPRKRVTLNPDPDPETDLAFIERLIFGSFGHPEMIIMNPEMPLNTPHTNSPRRTGLNGAFDVHYSRVEHLVEVWLIFKCNIYVQLMLICIECSLKLPLICYKSLLDKMYQFFYF